MDLNLAGLDVESVELPGDRFGDSLAAGSGITEVGASTTCCACACSCCLLADE